MPCLGWASMLAFCSSFLFSTRLFKSFCKCFQHIMFKIEVFNYALCSLIKSFLFLMNVIVKVIKLEPEPPFFRLRFEPKKDGSGSTALLYSKIRPLKKFYFILKVPLYTVPVYRYHANKILYNFPLTFSILI